MSVSVVIPTLNEGKHIKGCLDSIVAQNVQPLEVLIVDGFSTDNTRQLVESYKDLMPIKILDNPKQHRSSGLNIGVAYASGDYVARLDARTRIPKDYFEKCINTLKETGASNTGGIMVGSPTTKEQEKVSKAMGHRLGTGGARFRSGGREGRIESVYPGFFRLEIFTKVGVFDDYSPGGATPP